VRVAQAFSPAGLSGLFSAHTAPQDVYRKGARGAGLALSRGVKVTVKVEEGEEARFECYLNGEKSELGLARRVFERVARRAGLDGRYRVVVEQEVMVPMGGGLGSSGASALATALAVGRALGTKLSFLELAREAHAAEVEEGTGLGTVSGLAVGGAVAVVRPGAPGYDAVVRLVADSSLRVVVGFYAPISKREVLRRDLSRVNLLGLRALADLLREPTIERFMQCSRSFAEQAGFMTERLRRAVEAAEAAGALAASQAMIGETVFALADPDVAGDVEEALRGLGARAFTAEIHWGPAYVL